MIQTKTVKECRHVIFLGAGASASSGYPMGKELRLRMSSGDHLREELAKTRINKQAPTDLEYDAFSGCMDFWGKYGDSVELFRKGGFGTVDEFSKLASSGFTQHVQAMKNLMRLAFALHNPEDAFQESDYYPFIQRLFDENLDRLKPEVTIITFNYDCYLDYLLLRAYQQRQRLSKNSIKVGNFEKAKLTSGFFAVDQDFEWAQQTLQFNYFKLHGSITYGNEKEYGFKTLFEMPHVERLKKFKERYFATPPIVFPWEVFNKDGTFINQEEFIFLKEKGVSALEKSDGYRLFEHFKAMWAGAKWAVEHADKISFVGLSLHPYLDNGFKFLLKNNRKVVQVVVANIDNEFYKEPNAKFHPLSPCGKVASLLNTSATEMKWVPSRTEKGGKVSYQDFEKEEDFGITARYSFKEFIEKEMN